MQINNHRFLRLKPSSFFQPQSLITKFGRLVKLFWRTKIFEHITPFLVKVSRTFKQNLDCFQKGCSCGTRIATNNAIITSNCSQNQQDIKILGNDLVNSCWGTIIRELNELAKNRLFTFELHMIALAYFKETFFISFFSASWSIEFHQESTTCRCNKKNQWQWEWEWQRSMTFSLYSFNSWQFKHSYNRIWNRVKCIILLLTNHHEILVLLSNYLAITKYTNFKTMLMSTTSLKRYRDFNLMFSI